jgi:hypothetical protein
MYERQILDVTAALAAPLALEEALHEALAIVTKALQVARGAFFVRSGAASSCSGRPAASRRPRRPRWPRPKAERT